MNAKISNPAQVVSVRRYTLTEGPEAGLDVLDCDNGKLRFLVNVSRACDIMQLYHEGQNMSFISKNGFINNSDTSFMERFEGGMLYTCGLDSLGAREGYPMHGSLHNTVSRVLSARADTESGIVIEAEIRNTALFGKNLVLKRKITSAAGEESLLVEDELCNEGYATEGYCLLYHVNLGYPMLDAGGRIEADVAVCDPRDGWATECEATRFAIKQPVPTEPETCYFLTLRQPQIRYVNPALGKSFTLSYSGDTLPAFIEWKTMASGDYALGFEPCTCGLDDRFAYTELAAGETVKFFVKMEMRGADRA